MNEGFETVLHIMITRIKSLIMVGIYQSMTSERNLRQHSGKEKK
jgi:hypothetical protein